MPPRFLLDEHVTPAIQRQLRRLAPEIIVHCVGGPGAPPKGTSDQELLRWAAEQRFVLISEDRSTLPDCLRDRLASDQHSFGILWIRPGASLGQVIEDLHLIWQICHEDEFYDLGIYIPLQKILATRNPQLSATPSLTGQ